MGLGTGPQKERASERWLGKGGRSNPGLEGFWTQCEWQRGSLESLKKRKHWNPVSCLKFCGDWVGGREGL